MLGTFKNPMKRHEALWGYIMISPMVIGLGIFFYVALGASLVISLRGGIC